MFKVIFYSVFYCLIVSSVLSAFAVESALGNNDSNSPAHNALSSRYYALSERFHTQHALATPAEKATNLSALQKQILGAVTAGQNFEVVQRISAHKKLFFNEIDSAEALALYRLLLQNEALNQANGLIDIASQSGSAYTLAKMYYALALFYYSRNDWAGTMRTLDAIEVRNALTRDENDYAILVYGISLQNVKKHRMALKYYEQIKPDSRYFGYSQLNKAIAYIRQGWWTDAKLTIDSTLLASKKSALDEDLVNRMLLVIGFSQIHHEFYRDARDNFRKITLDSQYANRALLGIGLSALHQGDYVGAINAFGVLKKKHSDDISVMQSWLLSAFTHTLLNEDVTASVQYAEAVAHYQTKLNDLDARTMLLRLEVKKATPHTEQNTELQGQIKDAIPPWLLTHKKNLERYMSLSKSKKHTQEIKGLYSQYTNFIQAELDAYSSRKKDVIASYLGQSQFGEAQIFDTEETP